MERGIAVWSTRAWRRCADAHAYLRGSSYGATTQTGQIIPLLLCYPCFIGCQMFFWLAYSINRRCLARR